MTRTGSSEAPSVAETHISTVFFTSDRAYKLLKPIQTHYLDFSSVEARAQAVSDEIDLNRRMAPSVYLGAADVYENDKLADRMIVMRRLPHDRRLSSLVQDPELDSHLRAVARTVAAFHAAEPPLPDEVEAAGRDAVAGNWQDNVEDMMPLIGEVFDPDEFDRITMLSRRYLDYSESLFARRLAEGFVRDGHGDLTAEDIFCLRSGPQILDCLAFSRKLRIADVLCDVAFLAMDMERLSGPAAADRVWHHYAEFSDEHHPESLADHYVAYRAHVRAKIAALRHRQGDPAAASLARSYLQICRRRLERARRRLVIVGGSPGTGKTTLASRLSSSMRWPAIGSDALRKELTGRAPHEHDFAAPGEGIYTSDISDRTYQELHRRAELLLSGGESVILDASYHSVEERSNARDVAARCGADLVEIECVLDSEIAKARIERRLLSQQDPSDARPEILDQLRAQQQRWPEAVAIETKGPAELVTQVALGHIAQR